MILQARDRAGNVFAQRSGLSMSGLMEFALLWLSADPPALCIVREPGDDE